MPPLPIWRGWPRRRWTATRRALSLAGLLAGMVGCSPATPAVEDRRASPSSTTTLVVDSARPMRQMIEQFQQGTPAVAALQYGAPDRETLVRSFLDALTAGDTAALASMIISRAEFAHLYFPSSVIARAPYELDPALAWFQVRVENERALGKALRRYAGRALIYVGHDCSPKPAEGASRIWTDCVVTYRSESGGQRARLFTSIIETGGRFKFFSYANRL